MDFLWRRRLDHFDLWRLHVLKHLDFLLLRLVYDFELGRLRLLDDLDLGWLLLRHFDHLDFLPLQPGDLLLGLLNLQLVGIDQLFTVINRGLRTLEL